MEQKPLLIGLLFMLLFFQVYAQSDCPTARVNIGVTGADELKYNRASQLGISIKNNGDTDAKINKVSADVGYISSSCRSYNVPAGGSSECTMMVSPVQDKPLNLQVDYEYISCGRTRVSSSSIAVIESAAIAPAQSAQAYSIDVHGDCENSYYACSSQSSSGKYYVGYKCYNKDGRYYTPAKERLNLKYDLPAVSKMAVYSAKLKVSVSALKRPQELSVYRIGNWWSPTDCQAGGDICTQPYCSECKTLFASGSQVASAMIYAEGDISFDVTQAVRSAYSSGERTLSLQIRGQEDVWETSQASSCGITDAWVTQDAEILADEVSRPRLVINYLGKDVSPSGQSFADEICTDCCAVGETTCKVICDGGSRMFNGAEMITNCAYDGQVVIITRGTITQEQNCANGRCDTSASTTTTQGASTTTQPSTTSSAATSSSSVTTSSSGSTTTLSSGNCIDGTPVGQCSTWIDGMRCVDSPWGPTFEYDSSCSTNPNPTTPPTSMPSPIDMCWGTPVGQCSTLMDCARCVDDPAFGPYLDYDASCCGSTPSSTISPTTPPTSMPSPTDACFGTAVGDCSTWMQCFRCVDDPAFGPYLDYDDTCCSSSTTLTPTTGLSTTSLVTTSIVTTSFASTTFVSTTTTSSASTSSAPTSSTQATTTVVTTTSSTTTTQSNCVPAYDPGRWNNDRRALNCNNCYNYGCDKQTDNFAQPGYAHGYRISLECSSVIQGANKDGLKYLGKTDGACTGCMHKVALVVAPGTDFHWYRLDSNGMWSHKPGSTTVRDVDESGNKISSPENADRGIYTAFCGYFCVDKTAVSIAGGSSCPY